MTRELIQLILISGEFPHVFNRRKLVETHISYVILGASFAYKFKKEIKYSFLDFSTLQMRKYFCERELMLNNRLTKGIYIEVVPVRREKNIFTINGTHGKIVDYAIKMKRMQDAKQMHLMLEKKQVTTQHIKALAVVIKKFHDRADVVDRKYDQDAFSSRFNDIHSIIAIVRKKLGVNYEMIIENAMQISDHFLENHRELFNQRVEKSFIRDCHGDLHSRNIFLYAKPIIFDCIEFNDEYRQIDVLDEIAFFCMDLEANGFHLLSKAFIGKYFEKTKNKFGRSEQLLFTYYKCYRANVRAKVNALRAQSSEGEVQIKNLAEVQKYLTLMDAYTMEVSLI